MKPYQDRTWLHQKCLVEKLTDCEMAELAGCSEGSIQRHRSRFGVYRPKVQNRSGRKRFLIYQPTTLLSKSETIKAAVAGFCDGGGCVSITKAKRRRSSRYTYTVNVIFTRSQGDRIRTLRSIQHHYGGFMFGYERTRLESRIAQLRIGIRQSEILLRDMLPFMKTRRNQALVGLELIELKRNKPSTRSGSQYDDFMRMQEELNQKNHWHNRKGTPASRRIVAAKRNDSK